MKNKTEPKITDYQGTDFTKITFYPDLKRFGMKVIE